MYESQQRPPPTSSLNPPGSLESFSDLDQTPWRVLKGCSKLATSKDARVWDFGVCGLGCYMRKVKKVDEEYLAPYVHPRN